MSWIYYTTSDDKYRYALGEVRDVSDKILFCFGINPSTACPECIDNTIKKIINISKHNGYENWIMLNIYPQRATNPDDIHIECDENLVRMNLSYINNITEKYSNYDILFAYGNLITKRKYLKICLNEITALLKDKKDTLIKVIKLTKDGNPVHPLYQSNTSLLIDYTL